MSNISFQVTGISQIDSGVWENNDKLLLLSINNWKNRNDKNDFERKILLYPQQTDVYLVEDLMAYNRFISKATKYYPQAVRGYGCFYIYEKQQIKSVYLPYKEELMIY